MSEQSRPTVTAKAVWVIWLAFLLCCCVGAAVGVAHFDADHDQRIVQGIIYYALVAAAGFALFALLGATLGWRRLRRGVVVVVILALVVGVPAVLARVLGQGAELTAQTGLEPDALSGGDHLQLGGHTYIMGGSTFLEVDNATGRVVHQLAVSLDETILVGEQGNVLAVTDDGRASLYPAESAGENWAPSWEFESRAPDHDDLQPLALGDGTAVFQQGCRGDDQSCSLVAVRDGHAVWRRPLDAAVEAARAPGAGYLNALSSGGLQHAPTTAVGVRDDALVSVDLSGRVAKTSAPVAEFGETWVVADRIFTIRRQGDSCTVLGFRGARELFTGSPFGCPKSEQMRLFPSRAYVYGESDVGTEADDLISLDLTTGEPTHLERATGVVGFGPTAVVGGSGGRFVAQSASTGRPLWRRDLPFADPEDGWLGTGIAAASRDTAAVWSAPPESWQVAAGIHDRDLVTVLDLATGEPRDRFLTPAGGAMVAGLIALPEHRALAILVDGKIWMLGA